MRLYRELAGIYRINGLDNEVCVVYVRPRVDMADTSLRVAVNSEAWFAKTSLIKKCYSL